MPGGSAVTGREQATITFVASGPGWFKAYRPSARVIDAYVFQSALGRPYYGAGGMSELWRLAGEHSDRSNPRHPNSSR